MDVIQIAILMGVACAGKSTIGRQLAASKLYSFQDADEFCPPENVAKVSAGLPLTDADREPWLQTINEFLLEMENSGINMALACSALKVEYRRKITKGLSNFVFVNLELDINTADERIRNRSDHFFSPNLLLDQFNVFEKPTANEPCLHLDATKPVSCVVAETIRALRRDNP